MSLLFSPLGNCSRELIGSWVEVLVRAVTTMVILVLLLKNVCLSKGLGPSFGIIDTQLISVNR